MHRLWIIFAAALACCAATQRASAQGRFTAEMSDGTRVNGNELVGWHDTSAQPRLDAMLLFDPANPVRWLRDRTLAADADQGPFVEFVLGDRLPGRATGFRPAPQSAMLAVPPCLSIEPSMPLQLPDRPQRQEVRIDVRWLRRVAWQPRGGAWQPSTVFCRDGRRIKFRSLRWSETSVRLLLEEGTAEVPFSAIAELHLPRIDPWAAYYEQLATLGADDLLMTVETIHGATITGSLSRFQARAAGSHDPEAWYHLLQPAWSLDPLWLRHRSIVLRRFHRPWEVPLSDIEPQSISEPSVLGRGWRTRVNRSVHGGPLVSGGDAHGWGFGVHAANRLEFLVPSAAKTFRTRLGIDAASGRGGCAEGSILGGQQGTELLFRSQPLVGSATVVDSGPLPLRPPADGSGRLVLEAGMAHDGRPAGADPLDIRDALDWLEPQLDFDRSALQLEVQRLAPRAIAAWDGWSADAPGNAVQVASYWDASDPAEPQYRLLVQPRERFLSLVRRVRVPAAPQWLLLAADRPAETTSPARLQVQIDGTLAAEFEVPERHAGSVPDPLLVSLAPYQGREVSIEILQLPSGEKGWVDWRAISLFDRSPAVRDLFDDEPAFVAGLDQGTGEAALDFEDKHSGQCSLKVSGGARGGAGAGQFPAAIREQPRMGEYRYLRFAWKKPDGRRIRLSLGHDGRIGPDNPAESDARRTFRYAAGRRDPTGGQELLHPKLPTRWTVVTRDLFADFGQFELTGLSFESPDGAGALFDRIILGRTLKDLDEAAP